jgi:predicted Zn-dependent peptidase
MSAFSSHLHSSSRLRAGNRPGDRLDLSTSVLANGLTIASVRLPGFRTAAVGAFVRVGSRDEPAALNGLSHFFEHMAFKGTSSRDARRLSLDIERVGASMNAYTAKDHTAYHTVLLPAHMPVALDVLADVIRRSTFPPQEIERERQVILQELGDAADDPDSVCQDEFDLKAFPKQSFGRPILGSPRFVRSVSRDDFIGHMNAHYSADRIVVVGVGDLDPDAFTEQVAQRFGDMPRGSGLQREAVHYVGGFRHVEDDYEQTAVALGWPVPGRTDAAWPVYEMLGELLGGGMSSPLFQAVREERGLAYQVDAWTEGHDDCGILQVNAGVSPRNLRVFFDVVCDELLALSREVSADDLERTRNQQATHLARSLERPMELAESVARDLLAHGRVVSPDERIATTLSISADDLSAAARSLLASPPTLVLVGRGGRGDHLAAVRRRLGT